MSPKTSWEPLHDWYDQTVGEEGHYYHQHIILPKVQPWLKDSKKVLDVGCGQGILARHLPKKVDYFGIDISPSLISKAKTLQPHKANRFMVQDATVPFVLKEKDFSHATMILCLQNMADPQTVFKNISNHLADNGELLLVLNHPCFRIPRQSSWAIDQTKKLQSRKTDRYMTPMEIPIHTHPSQGSGSTTSITFHNPLSFYSKLLHENDFVIEIIDEWCSDKMSSGAAAKMENRARKEFPLFLAILARKNYPAQKNRG